MIKQEQVAKNISYESRVTIQKEGSMLQNSQFSNRKNYPVGPFSLDAWAVALALGLAALIWVGVLKHVPW